MSKSLVWITAHDSEAGLGHSAHSHLYVREWRGAFLPQPGQTVDILRSPEEDEWSCSATVKSVTFDLDGTAHIHLVDYHIDPPEMMQRHMDGKYRSAWWTDRDGDLKEALEYSGWLTYDQWRAQ